MTRITALARRLTTPLLPDDYLTLFNPLLTLDSYRARIVRVEEEAAGVRTLHLRTARDFPAHQAGQHVRVGVDLNAVRNWRSFSLTAPETGDATRELTITVKATGSGGVSDHLVHRSIPGDIVHLEPPAGDFTLASAVHNRAVLIAGGSGVTPLLSIVRTLAARDDQPKVTFVLCARTTQDMIRRRELTELADAAEWFELILWPTAALGHFDGKALEREIPDWRSADAFVCGPAGLLTTADEMWRGAGALENLHVEQFNTRLGNVDGDGGTVQFAKSGRSEVAAATTPLLEAGENAGVLMPSGCRIGICHTCVVPLTSGKVRDLRTGEVHGEPGDIIQTCINAAACDVEIDV